MITQKRELNYFHWVPVPLSDGRSLQECQTTVIQAFSSLRIFPGILSAPGRLSNPFGFSGLSPALASRGVPFTFTLSRLRMNPEIIPCGCLS
ncbi:MAG: hypothetical protein NTU44_19970 [Bacteroidetes bacterium]|nr:hypothetical protein [Bacteroidota bacterium]